MVKKLATVSKLQTKCGKVIEEYLDERGKRSPSTANNYRSDFSKFLKVVFSRKIDTITEDELDLLEVEDLFGYRNTMYGNVKNNTINRHMSSIKSILRYLKKRNMLESEITYLDLIESLPDDTTEIEYMSKEVVERYIGEAGRETHHNELKQCLIVLAADTGLRQDELLSLSLSQFTPVGEVVTIKGRGKGNVIFSDKISVSLYRVLLDLISQGKAGSDKIFSALNAKSVSDMMTRIKNNLGYQDRAYSFHSFKKTAVTFAYRLTGDVLEAQKKGRHKNLETTRLYLKDEDYGVTGMFSLGNHDPELYKKVSYEELIQAVGEMNKDFLHLLNIKLNEKNNQTQEVSFIDLL